MKAEGKLSVAALLCAYCFCKPRKSFYTGYAAFRTFCRFVVQIRKRRRPLSFLTA